MNFGEVEITMARLGEQFGEFSPDEDLRKAVPAVSEPLWARRNVVSAEERLHPKRRKRLDWDGQPPPPVTPLAQVAVGSVARDRRCTNLINVQPLTADRRKHDLAGGSRRGPAPLIRPESKGEASRGLVSVTARVKWRHTASTATGTRLSPSLCA